MGRYLFELIRDADGEKATSLTFELRDCEGCKGPQTSSTTKLAPTPKYPIAASTGSAAGSASEKSSSSDSGLSTSALAGIVIGSLAGAFLLLGGVVFWMLRRKRRRARAASGPTTGASYRTPAGASGSEPSSSIELADREKNPAPPNAGPGAEGGEGGTELPREPAPPYSRFPPGTRRP